MERELGEDKYQESSEEVIDRVLTCATRVHKKLGPGLNESVYRHAMMIELKRDGLSARAEVEVPVTYDDVKLPVAFRADIIVEGCLLLELKSVEAITDLHLAQTINYLRLLKFRRGFILNFNVRLMKLGIKRVSIGPITES
jgi:GxxExxY protein